MNVVQGQTLLYPLESDESNNSIPLKLRDLLVRMHVLVSDITTIDEAVEVSKYVLKYNCRLPYTKHNLNLIRSK